MNPNALPIRAVLPPGWRGLLSPDGRLGIGVDLGTTTRAKSNPTVIALAQQVGQDYFARLLLRYKTDRPEVTEQLLRQIILGVVSLGLRVGRLCIDATSERFFAAQLQQRLRGQTAVDLIISSAGTEYLGQHMNYKTYLGNLYLNTIDEGRLALPSAEWVEKDARQVKVERGQFDADVDEEGNHADAFDATKLALHALRTHGGGASASAASVGNSSHLGQPSTVSSGVWRKPVAGDKPAIAV